MPIFHKGSATPVTHTTSGAQAVGPRVVPVVTLHLFDPPSHDRWRDSEAWRADCCPRVSADRSVIAGSGIPCGTGTRCAPPEPRKSCLRDEVAPHQPPMRGILNSFVRKPPRRTRQHRPLTRPNGPPAVVRSAAACRRDVPDSEDGRQRGRLPACMDQPVVESLVIPLPVIMSKEDRGRPW